MTLNLTGPAALPAADLASASVGYLGWSGRRNLGDDVLFEVIAAALPEVSFGQLPMSAGEVARTRLAGVARRRKRPLILGGGTAVGRRNWRAALRVAGLACGAEHHLIGVGVEDPAFQGLHSFSAGGELAKWRPVLERFERVTVRGPNSARLLAETGVDSTVVGDPALLLRDHVDRPVRGQALAISLGYGDDLWGHDHRVVVDAVATVAERAVRDGQEVVFLIVNPGDTDHAKAIAQRLPEGSYHLRTPATAAEFFDAAADCGVLIAERLHAGILAVSAGLPTVMIEYQPKVRDFMKSVALGQLCVRSDRLTPGGLTELLELAVTDRAAQERMAVRVGTLRRALAEEIDLLATSVRERLAA